MIGDRARVSVSVAVSPAFAFDCFTADIDRWWRRGFKYRHSPSSSSLIRIEPGIGGRLFESFAGADGEHVQQVGKITVWEPPHRLAFTWRNANFAPTEQTQVTVDFVAAAGGTLLTVTHEGLAALPAAHPARHGRQGSDFSVFIGMWWSEQLTSLREMIAS